jgi:hypothetical protein
VVAVVFIRNLTRPTVSVLPYREAPKHMRNLLYPQRCSCGLKSGLVIFPQTHFPSPRGFDMFFLLDYQQLLTLSVSVFVNVRHFQ